MRILFIGDPHIKTDNHDEINILLLQLESICEEQKVDRIIIGGDLMHYHERIFTQALNKTLEFVTRLSLKCPVDILVGNHDMINNQQFLNSNHWLNVFHSYHHVTVIDKPIKRILKDFVYLLCPYVYPGRFIEALETLGEWKQCNMIFAHQEFKGCKMGAIVSTEGDDWKAEYPQVISGHIHDNQTVNNIYYPGSPLQHAFGDTDKRVVCIIENGDIRDIELDVPKKKMVKTSIKDLSANIKSSVLSNCLKIKLKATVEEFKIFKQTNEYKDYVDKGVKIQLDKIESKDIPQLQETSFQSILYHLIESDGDSLLRKIYNEIK
jgi:DNA repair exonuclease SbcCD nuclease subunit